MDIILYNIIACFASLIFGYFFGSIPVGVILCRLFRGKDPRDFGSKNSGGTNVGRIFGMKLGAFTIILDAIKTILPMILVWIFLKKCGISEIFVKNYGKDFYHNGSLIIYFAPLGATIGHCWPIFADFRGGKAVSNAAGFMFFTCWPLFLLCFIAFSITLKVSKHVSLSSIVGSVAATILTWVMFIIDYFTDANFNICFWNFSGNELWASLNLEFAICITLITVILILRHSKNIKRLADGCESKIKWIK